MTVIVNAADVPTVSGDDLYQPMRWLIESGQGLALLNGMTAAELAALDDQIWSRFEGADEVRIAVALRFRALITVFAARRLRDLLLARGFKVIRAAIEAAARERLNTHLGFKSQRLVMAVEAATAPAMRAATFEIHAVAA